MSLVMRTEYEERDIKSGLDTCISFVYERICQVIYGSSLVGCSLMIHLFWT